MVLEGVVMLVSDLWSFILSKYGLFWEVKSEQANGTGITRLTPAANQRKHAFLNSMLSTEVLEVREFATRGDAAHIHELLRNEAPGRFALCKIQEESDLQQLQQTSALIGNAPKS